MTRRTARLAQLAVAIGVVSGSLAYAAGPAGAADLATDYPSISLRPGDTATFEVRMLVAERETVELSVGDSPKDWPQVVAIVALTVLLFAITYIVFMRQEIRA